MPRLAVILGATAPRSAHVGLLGAGQKAWFKRELQASPARWKVVANQVMIMSLDLVPGVSSALNPDAWDGYGRERREILGHLRSSATRDVTFITGDIHTFFAGNVHANGRFTGPRVATEFVGGSVTSAGIEDIVGQPGVTEPAVRAANPHLRYTEHRSRGYGVLEARPDELLVTFRSPLTVDAPTAPVRTLARFRWGREGGGGARLVTTIAIIPAMDSECVRLDRWLWAARLVKTRGLAVEAIGAGRVHVNGRRAKPSTQVAAADRIEITAGQVRRCVVVRATAQRRGPASEAVLLYEETPASVAARERHAAQRRLTTPPGPTGGARPTKRDRRRLDADPRSRRGRR